MDFAGVTYLTENEAYELTIPIDSGMRLQSRSRYFKLLAHYCYSGTLPTNLDLDVATFCHSASGYYPPEEPSSMLRAVTTTTLLNCIKILALPSSSVYVFIPDDQFFLPFYLNAVLFLDSEFLFSYLVGWYMHGENLAHFLIFAYHFYGETSTQFRELYLIYRYLTESNALSLANLKPLLLPYFSYFIDARLQEHINESTCQMETVIPHALSINCIMCDTPIPPSVLHDDYSAQLTFMPCCGTSIHPACFLHFLASLVSFAQPHDPTLVAFAACELPLETYISRACANHPFVAQSPRCCPFCSVSFTISSFLPTAELFLECRILRQPYSTNRAWREFDSYRYIPHGPSFFEVTMTNCLKHNSSLAFHSPYSRS